MPRNSGGVYSLPAGNPVVTGTVIESTWANTTLNDLSVAMTDSLSRTGSGGMLVAMEVADGTETNPAYSFTDAPTYGMYLDIAGTSLKFSAAGTFGLSVSPSGGTLVGSWVLPVDIIDTPEIKDDAVTTPKILNDAVTTPKVIDDAVTTPKVVDKAITLPKLLEIATQTAIGRDTAATGVPESVTIEQMLNWFTSIAQGDILFRGAAGFERLGAGVDEQFLQTKGAAADPQWTTITTPLTKEYISPAQTITTAGLLTLNHGLGEEPKLVQYFLQCIADDNGYTVGQRVVVDINSTVSGTSRINTPRVGGTSINIRLSSATSCFSLGNRTTGVAAPALNAKWQLYVKAFA